MPESIYQSLTTTNELRKEHMMDMDIYIVNWCHPEKLTQDNIGYIETDGQYFGSHEEAKEYAEKEVAAGDRPSKYRIEELWRNTQ